MLEGHSYLCVSGNVIGPASPLFLPEFRYTDIWDRGDNCVDQNLCQGQVATPASQALLTGSTPPPRDKWRMLFLHLNPAPLTPGLSEASQPSGSEGVLEAQGSHWQ